MQKNITLSAEESLIKKARQKAQKEQTTLNSRFRRWLEWYVSANAASNDYTNLMKELEYAASDKIFSREELNER